MQTDPPTSPAIIRSIPFGERPGDEPYNASEVVFLGDSRFLLCDNNVGDALFELRLTPDGGMACPLLRRRLHGIEPGAIDDLEGIELVSVGGRTFLFATSSLALKKRKHARREQRHQGKVAPAREAILRVTIDEQEELHAEIISAFRPWLIEQAPELVEAARRLPDDGGLNIEALSWDPRHGALLLGARTPLVRGMPLVVRVRLKVFDGPWDLSNFELLPSIRLAVEVEGRGVEGLRAMGYDLVTGLTLFTVGNAISGSKARFELYSWDGNEDGVVRYFSQVRFDPRMKVEGVARGTIAGRAAVVFVDDRGGYQVLWADDPRLAVTTGVQR
jgi:hypothetical protein